MTDAPKCLNCNELAMVGDPLCVDCRYDEDRLYHATCPVCDESCTRPDLGDYIGTALCPSCGWEEELPL
jgi:hypothetical protein